MPRRLCPSLSDGVYHLIGPAVLRVSSMDHKCGSGDLGAGAKWCLSQRIKLLQGDMPERGHHEERAEIQVQLSWRGCNK